MHPALPTVVLGAGISGLIVARALHTAGKPVVLLEKSRGPGGRMATKRVGDVSFDQGAQYFTARDPEFLAQVELWRHAGWITDWPGGAHRRLIGRPAMTAIAKGLVAGLDVRREHKVTALRRTAEGAWELLMDQQPAIVAARVLLTCPAPQALAVLDAGGVTLPAEMRTALDRLTYHPCLALLAVLAGPSAVPLDGLAFTEGPVRWLADNVKKGVAHGVPAAVTIHAAPEFSAAHYTASETDVAAQLLPAVAAHLGAPVTSTTLHRWKFSEPKATHPERCVWLPELGLGFAGDAFGGPKVEGAALSGLALSRALGCGV
jgi:predicted NAD/FAD-dependent oxidoreductase